MTHLILWTGLMFVSIVAAFFGACSWSAALIWSVATFVALALHSLFGEEA